MTPGLFPTWRVALETLIGAALVFAFCAVVLLAAWWIVVVVLV
jgi:hypothetical protein